MRTLCIILNVVLIIIVFLALQAATSLYTGFRSLDTFGVSLQQVNKWELPYVLSFIVYAVSFGFAMYFFIKKKFRINIAIAAVMMAVYIAGPYLGYAWLR
jgi:hypothetical protein